MSREEVVRDIGTIARSGSREFLTALKAKQGAGDVGTAAADADLIGQFGVGFYSTFMVADRVVLTTRRAGADTAVRWESTGDGTYTLDEASRPQAGTTVVLHLKPADEEDGRRDYTDPFALREIVKKHSDFVAHPIRMRVERQEPVLDNTGQPVKGVLPKTVVEDETFNSMKAIWTRSRGDVADDEYNEFYRHLSHELARSARHHPRRDGGRVQRPHPAVHPPEGPLRSVSPGAHHQGGAALREAGPRHGRLEGAAARVAALPEGGHRLRGPLAERVAPRSCSTTGRSSRSATSRSRRPSRPSGSCARTSRTPCRAFWREFGAVLKEGLATDGEHRDRLLDLILCATTHGDEPTSLADYVERMPDGQEHIYYLGGASIDAVRHSPHLESFIRKGIEVLFFADAVDEFWLERDLKYKDKTFVSVS